MSIDFLKIWSILWLIVLTIVSMGNNYLPAGKTRMANDSQQGLIDRYNQFNQICGHEILTPDDLRRLQDNEWPLWDIVSTLRVIDRVFQFNSDPGYTFPDEQAEKIAKRFRTATLMEFGFDPDDMEASPTRRPKGKELF